MNGSLVWGTPSRQTEFGGFEHLLPEVLARAARSPWYRLLLPGPIRSLQDVPVLTRQDLLDNADELRIPGVPRALMKKVATSGSSGHPVSLWLDRAITLSEWRFQTKQWARIGYSRRSWRLRLHGFPSVMPGGRLLTKTSSLKREVHLSSIHLSEETLDQYLDVISSVGAPFLHTFPSIATRILDLCIVRGRRPPRFKGLLLGSEHVSPRQRAWLSQTYDAPVFTWYGQSEKVLLGGECPYSPDYHLFPGYGLAEIIDDDGAPIVESGRPGRLLGTGFLNYGAPLLRYEVGDTAAWAEGPCKCGWSGQRLTGIIGRRQDFITTPTGARLSVAELALEDELIGHVRSFQYVQRGEGDIEVRVVPAASWDESETARLERSISELLPGCSVRINVVSNLYRQPNGKVPLVVRNDIREPSQAAHSPADVTRGSK